MNDNLERFAREYIQKEVGNFPATAQTNFRLAFGRSDGKRSAENALSMTIADIVAEIPAKDLSAVMDLVDRTIAALAGGRSE